MLSSMQNRAFNGVTGDILSELLSNSSPNKSPVISCLKQTLVGDVCVIDIKPFFKGLILDLAVSSDLDNFLHPVQIKSASGDY